MIDFDDTTVEEARDFLISRSIELDDTTLDPAQKGLCFLIREPRDQGRSPGTTSEPEGGGLR